eukprot:1650334-Pleurochrysis_carterae.AAC.1
MNSHSLTSWDGRGTRKSNLYLVLGSSSYPAGVCLIVDAHVLFLGGAELYHLLSVLAGDGLDQREAEATGRAVQAGEADARSRRMMHLGNNGNLAWRLCVARPNRNLRPPPPLCVASDSFCLQTPFAPFTLALTSAFAPLLALSRERTSK